MKEVSHTITNKIIVMTRCLPAFRRLEVGVEGVGGLALLFVLVVESGGTEDAPSG